MSAGLHFRVLRTEADIDAVRQAWSAWQQHPQADIDFFQMIVKVRSEVISPYVVAMYRGDELETLLVGRLERGYVSLTFGYWHLLRVPVRQLTFVYRGVLGNASPDNCAALFRYVKECLVREDVQLASFHFVNVDSALFKAVRAGSGGALMDLTESRPHWVMKLPSHVDEIYKGMSPKARKNRRYEAARLAKDFDNQVRMASYSSEGDLDRVMDDAEAVASRTYQRGLGVGFEAGAENRTRFLMESQRGRFRAYVLYVREKPIAFFLGTLYGNVLYDNFTAYDPEFSRYSPGTVLFFQIFEKLCQEGVEAVDFGFGDAWYKSQFGTENAEETNVRIFAKTMSGVGLNLLRVPVTALDRAGKRAIANLGFLHSVKKRWRDRARRRAAA
jgi:hypothetical protein